MQCECHVNWRCHDFGVQFCETELPNRDADMPRPNENAGIDLRHSMGIRVPAGAPPWVTGHLLSATIETWQPHYEQPLTPEDTLQILLNVDRLMRVLEDPEDENDDPEIRRSRPRLQP